MAKNYLNYASCYEKVTITDVQEFKQFDLEYIQGLVLKNYLYIFRKLPIIFKVGIACGVLLENQLDLQHERDAQLGFFFPH